MVASSSDGLSPVLCPTHPPHSDCWVVGEVGLWSIPNISPSRLRSPFPQHSLWLEPACRQLRPAFQSLLEPIEQASPAFQGI